MTLGLILIWIGYTSGVYGFAKIKSAYGAPGLGVADVALPSHRTTYLTVAQGWSNATTTTAPATKSAAATTAPATNAAPSTTTSGGAK